MNLLRSRKFVLAIVAIITYLVALAVPDLREYAADFGGILFAVVGVATATITLEDSVRLWATRPQSLQQAILDAVEEAVKTLPSGVQASTFGMYTSPRYPGDPPMG